MAGFSWDEVEKIRSKNPWGTKKGGYQSHSLVEISKCKSNTSALTGRFRTPKTLKQFKRQLRAVNLICSPDLAGAPFVRHTH